MKQVGWYCPGGHPGEGGQPVVENFRTEDPCKYAVPMYIAMADGPLKFTINTIAMPHVPDRIESVGVRCAFCSVRLDDSTRGQTCPNR